GHGGCAADGRGAAADIGHADADVVAALVGIGVAARDGVLAGAAVVADRAARGRAAVAPGDGGAEGAGVVALVGVSEGGPTQHAAVAGPLRAARRGLAYTALFRSGHGGCAADGRGAAADIGHADADVVAALVGIGVAARDGVLAGAAVIADRAARG